MLAVTALDDLSAQSVGRSAGRSARNTVGLGDDILSLFPTAGRPLRSLLVVDKSKQDALDVVTRFCNELPSFAIDRESAAFDGTFKQFVQGPALEEYVAGV